MQRLPFALGVEIRDASRRVIWLQLFGDAAVARADDIAGGEMQQRGVIGFAKKFDQVDGGFHVAGQRVAQIGIEIGQARAVDHQIERARQALARVRTSSRVRAG